MTTKALLSVRPRMNPTGAISMAPSVDQRPHAFHRQPVGESVVERAQIGGELVLEFAR